MSHRANAAGRLFLILKELSQRKSGTLADLANTLGCPPELDKMFVCMSDLQAEFKQLSKEISDIKKENERQFNLYDSKLPDIGVSINSISITPSLGRYESNVTQSSVVSLEFMESTLGQESVSSVSDLQSIRDSCMKLYDEIWSAESLDKTIREWLMDLVRAMMDGLDRYKVRGGRAIEKHLNEAIGSLVCRKDWVDNVKEKTPTVWEKFSSVLNSMNKAADFGDKIVIALEFTNNMIKLTGR